MKKLLKIILILLLGFSMFSIGRIEISAGYCDDPYGNPIPLDICPG